MTAGRTLLWVERIVFGAATLLASVYLIVTLHGVLAAEIALREFDEAVLAEGQTPAAKASKADVSDFSLWDPRRIDAYRKSLQQTFPPPLAVLDGNLMHGRVPVFAGTDDSTLNRGAGWIEGTSRPGEQGNVGVAGHRDGFFRVLKDVVVGDKISLQTPKRTMTYAVDQIEIVRPSDVDVLDPREHPSLTLITCYPFYFVGNAPQRYVVHARLLNTVARASTTPLTPGSHADLEALR